MIGIASQIISPTSVQANDPDSNIQSTINPITSSKSISNSFELDPEDPNPILFAMAQEKSNSDQSMTQNATQITASGLSITELVTGD